MLTLVFDAKQGHIQEKFAILASLSIDCLTRYSTLPDYLVMKQTYAINNFYYPGIHIIRARDITQKMPADHPHGHNGKFLACILLACKDIWSISITICAAFSCWRNRNPGLPTMSLLMKSPMNVSVPRHVKVQSGGHKRSG